MSYSGLPRGYRARMLFFPGVLSVTKSGSLSGCLEMMSLNCLMFSDEPMSFASALFTACASCDDGDRRRRGDLARLRHQPFGSQRPRATVSVSCRRGRLAAWRILGRADEVASF